MKSNEQQPRMIEGKVALCSMQRQCVATLGQMSRGQNWPVPRPAHIPLLQQCAVCHGDTCPSTGDFGYSCSCGGCNCGGDLAALLGALLYLTVTHSFIYAVGPLSSNIALGDFCESVTFAVGGLCQCSLSRVLLVWL